MKKIKLMALVSAIVMFICVFIYVSINSSDTDSSEQVSNGKIKTVVATQDIKPHTILTEELLQEKAVYPNDGVQEYRMKDILGKVSTSDIFAGEIITENRLSNADDEGLGLAYKLEDGKRAVSVVVDLAKGVGGNIKVGNYVDVVITYPIGDSDLSDGMMLRSSEGSQNTTVISDQFGNYFTMLVMQKLKVVALDETYYYNKNDIPDEQSYASVTLEATPEQINSLVFCDSDDVNIRLSLRSQFDNKVVNFPKDIILEGTN